ncbi:MAG: hypothetical protein WCH39_21730 [Schlesneria sp.]
MALHDIPRALLSLAESVCIGFHWMPNILDRVSFLTQRRHAER